MNRHQTKWLVKYEPKTLSDMVLNSTTRMMLERIERNPRHMMLYGPPGTGKNTFVNILEQNERYNFFKINAGLNGGIDMVRDGAGKGSSVASICMMAGRVLYHPIARPVQQFIIYNEAEKISADAMVALREIIETTAAIFIFLANDINNIDPAILSRTIDIEYKNPNTADIRQFAQSVLDSEGATIPGRLLNQILTPVNGSVDMRKIIEKLEFYAE